MKTRIKITEHKDGGKRFTPQYKGWFFWKDFTEEYETYSTTIYSFLTEEEAERFLDEELSCRGSSKVCEVAYKDYP